MIGFQLHLKAWDFQEAAGIKGGHLTSEFIIQSLLPLGLYQDCVCPSSSLTGRMSYTVSTWETGTPNSKTTGPELNFWFRLKWNPEINTHVPLCLSLSLQHQSPDSKDSHANLQLRKHSSAWQLQKTRKPQISAVGASISEQDQLEFWDLLPLISSWHLWGYIQTKP